MEFNDQIPVNMEPDAKILILEDHVDNALKMQTIFEDAGFEVVGIAKTNDEAYKFFAKNPVDLLACRVELESGEVTVKFVKKAMKKRKVACIFITSLDYEGLINKNIESFPEFVITMPFHDRQLETAAKCALHKFDCLPHLKKHPIPTARELDIILQLAKGRSSKEIADSLCVSYETVKSHKKNIFRKFNISSGYETIALAYKNQWLYSWVAFGLLTFNTVAEVIAEII